MKFKLSVLLILGVTAGAIALLDFIINRVDKNPIGQTSLAKINNEPAKGAPKLPSANKQALHERELEDDYEDDEEEEEDEDEDEPFALGGKHAPKTDITPQDIEKINGIVKLKDDELIAQIKQVESQLEANDLIDKLEEDSLSPAEKAKAKNLLEHFSMLNFERSRRKHMEKNPKYKDALAAHEQGLRGIRELLADE